VSTVADRLGERLDVVELELRDLRAELARAVQGLAARLDAAEAAPREPTARVGPTCAPTPRRRVETPQGDGDATPEATAGRASGGRVGAPGSKKRSPAQAAARARSAARRKERKRVAAAASEERTGGEP